MIVFNMAENILDRIANETDLTKSERKLANVILKDPSVVITENIASLAKRAEVSEPSVVRFCKRFGVDGYPALKLMLSSLVSSENLRAVENVKKGDTVENVISKVVDAAKVAVSATQRNTDEAVIARVIDVISQSRRVVVFSQGMSAFVGVDFTSRMLNLGFPCEHYTQSQEMSLAAATLHPGDVALAISSTGVNLDIIRACGIVKKSGAYLVTLTPENTRLFELSDLSIKAGERIDITNDSVFHNRLSMLLLCQIIMGGILLRRNIAVNDAKPKMAETRMEFYDVDKNHRIDPSILEQSLSEDNSIKPGSPIKTLDFDWRR